MARLQNLVQGWKSRGEMPNIERDMALEELRGLYDAILSGDVAITSESSKEEPAEVDASVALPIATVVATPVVAEPVAAADVSADIDIDALLGLSGEDPVVNETPAEEGVDEVAEVETVDVVEEVAAVEEPAEESTPAEEPEPTPEPASAVEPTPEPAPEPAPEPSPVAAAEEPSADVASNTAFGGGLFDVDDIPVRSRSGRKMISLYNAQPKQPKLEEEPIDKAYEPKSEPKVQPKVEPKMERTVERTVEPEAESKPVRLADVLGGGVKVLGDKISADEQPTTAFNRITDIRKAIGLNDKFLMIKDLFDGDAQRYENTIDTLNEFDDLDECMIYIVENFSWNPDSEGAKLLVSLIERKLA